MIDRINIVFIIKGGSQSGVLGSGSNTDTAQPCLFSLLSQEVLVDHQFKPQKSSKILTKRYYEAFDLL